MSVFDTLITDRSALDVAELNALRAKIIDRTATEEEWEAWVSGTKGSYNASDLNRVGIAVKELAEMINGYGNNVSVSPKTDWKDTDIPNREQMNTYLLDISALRGAISVPQSVPTAPVGMDSLSYDDANAIESILSQLYELVQIIAPAFRHSGAATSICGLTGGIIQ